MLIQNNQKLSVIYKYPIFTTFTLRLPVGAKPISIVNQNGANVMYVLQDKDRKITEDRQFECIATGGPFTGNLAFIGSFSPQMGLWFHLFERLA